MIRRLAGLAAFVASSVLATAAPAWLRQEPSAFLRSYAETQVEWMPWGEAAFARAQKEQKPIFVAVGSFGHELSRAMGRQTFAQPPVASFLNANFVCVLVDRDERPDVAALYATYVHGVKQLDGWPLNIWLTPELKPYDGATYLPPSEEWGKPSFMKVAQQAKETWANPAVARARANDGMALLGAASPPAQPVAPAKLVSDLDAAAAAWTAVADAEHGGFGDPPRYPEPELLRFLLQRSGADHDLALKTLRAIATSAVRDPLDGGFFRSATDDAWHVPNPQKMLVDQARIAEAYLDAAEVDAAFTDVARGALDYSLHRLALPDGTFAAFEDGSGDTNAGYFAWTAAEIDSALGTNAAAFKKAHGVEPDGNVPADFDPNGRLKGKNLLCSALGADATDRAAAAKLLALRDRRPALLRDERATAGAQGLLIAALARAGEQLHEPKYTQAAAKALTALRQHLGLTDGGDLLHQRDSKLAGSPADDLAVAFGCLELAHAGNAADAQLAAALVRRADETYFDQKTGRFFAAPATLPAGIVARPLAAADVVSAEPLAIFAGAASPQRDAIVGALVNAVENGATTPPGDVLLALSTKP